VVAARLRGVIFASVAALALLCSPCIAETLQVTVVSASAGTEEHSGRPILNIRLADESRNPLAAFSQTHVGYPVDMRLGGKTVLKPVLREPITGGVFQTTIGSMEKARLLAERLSAGPTVLELEVVPH
jgi:preprotein translocase subunit SecD